MNVHSLTNSIIVVKINTLYLYSFSNCMFPQFSKNSFLFFEKKKKNLSYLDRTPYLNYTSNDEWVQLVYLDCVAMILVLMKVNRISPKFKPLELPNGYRRGKIRRVLEGKFQRESLSLCTSLGLQDNFLNIYLGLLLELSRYLIYIFHHLISHVFIS